MTSPIANSEQDPNDDMRRYGITRVPADYFHYKEHRYSTLEEAMAEARRQQQAASPDKCGRTRLG
jgi:hypothetical protein